MSKPSPIKKGSNNTNGKGKGKSLKKARRQCGTYR